MIRKIREHRSQKRILGIVLFAALVSLMVSTAYAWSVSAPYANVPHATFGADDGYHQNQNVTARSQEDATIVLSEEDDQTGVSYLIGVDNLENELIARVEYDHDTMADINRYREFASQKLEDILQNSELRGSNIPLRITFNAPLSQEEFTSFVENYAIDVENYAIYMMESDGRIATIYGSPTEEELVPTAYFNSATDSITQEYAPNAKLLGWVEVKGIVQAKFIPQISNDSRVFLADAIQLFLESKLTDETLAKVGIARSVRQELLQFGFTEVYQRPLAWHVYHVSLEETDTQK